MENEQVEAQEEGAEEESKEESKEETSEEIDPKQLQDENTRLKRELTQKMKKLERLEESKPSKQKPDEKLMERLDNLALKTAGIKSEDEVELFNKWKEETGREADSIIESNIFQKELEDLRTAKANQEATSDVKGEKGESGVKNTPEYWISKATKGPDGKLQFPGDTPKELYSKILDKLAENEPSSSEELKFYN